jgi:predicted PurR-regulated permease PerM
MDDVTFSLRELFTFCLFVVSFGVGILIIVVLVKALSVINKLDGIVSENRENINELMTILPQTLDSVNQSVQSVKRTVDSAGEAIEFISENVAPKAAGAFAGVDSVIDVIRVVGEVVRAVIHHFRGKDE